jgi:predicted nucleotidyltransferase component of viral defense system
MKQEAMTILAGETDPNRKLNLLREYLQALALRSFHESGAFANLSFVGGTALRFLFGLPRFSEDLDFSLEKSSGYDLQKWGAKLERDLRFGGFDPAVTVKSGKVVESVGLRVSGLLHETGLAAHPAQKLSIKLEIDTKPPAGAQTEIRVVNRFFLMSIRHHDLPCLMAGKIRALLTRPYSKGRDWYDLLWYRTRVPPVHPSLSFLQASIDQGPKAKVARAENWKVLLEAKAREIDWKALADDVAPFLERPAEKEMLTRQSVERAIHSDHR